MTGKTQALIGLTLGMLAAFARLELSALALPILRFRSLGLIVSAPFVAVFSFRWARRYSRLLSGDQSVPAHPARNHP